MKNSEAVVCGKPYTEVVTNRTYLFTPDKDKLAEKGFLSCPGLFKCNQSLLVPVQMLAAENSNKTIYAGTRLGWISMVVEEPVADVLGVTNSDEIDDEKFLSMFNNNMKDISADNEHCLTNLLCQYKSIFSKGSADLGTSKLIEHHIDTGNALPIVMKQRRVPVGLEKKVDNIVEDLLKAGVIQQSTSPWSFPLVLVKKGNGDIRMCIDYRQLNAVTNRPIFPIPDIQELFDTISGSHYFSTLDMSSGYYQVELREEDKRKTAFSTRLGHFEFTKMPFGLSGAPATFQKLMSVLLTGVTWQGVVVYLDDVLVYGKTIEEHNRRLALVFDRFKDAGLKLNPGKCVFLKNEVKYLGHIIDCQGVRTDPEKIVKILEWPEPTTSKELHSFLGLCNYYRRFINKYAELTKGLQKSLNSKPFVWSAENRANFQELKRVLTEAPVLGLPKPEGRFILDTDASHDAMGAVLSQEQDGHEKVICYASNQLTKSQRKYCITRKELLAVHTYMSKFKHYLLGRRFVVRTDHRALLWILNWKKPITSQFCLWKADLEIYDFDILHRPGQKHSNADALSRIPPCGQCTLVHQDPKSSRHVKKLDNSSDAVESSVGGNHQPAVFPLQNLRTKGPDSVELIKTFLTRGNDSTVGRDELEDEETSKLWKLKDHLQVVNNRLYICLEGTIKLIPEQSSRDEIIRSFHNSLGHPGVDKTVSLMTNYYWPHLKEDIRAYIGACEFCSRCKKRKPCDRSPLKPTVTLTPFQQISLDTIGPFQKTKHGHVHILVVVDHFSKFSALIPLKSLHAAEIAFKLWREWLAVFGMPSTIFSDKGSGFESQFFKKLCTLCSITKLSSCAFYHQANGLVERLVQTVKPMLSAICLENKSRQWDVLLPSIEMCLRASKQKSLNCSPYEVVFGRDMTLDAGRLAVPDHFINRSKLHQEIFTRQFHTNQKQKAYYDHGNRAQSIRVGTRVMVENVGAKRGVIKEKFVGPFEVVGRIGQWTYILRSNNGKIFHRTYNQLKRVQPRGERRERPPTPADQGPQRSSTAHSQAPHHHQQPVPSQRPTTPPQQGMRHQHQPLPQQRRYPIRTTRGVPPHRFV